MRRLHACIAAALASAFIATTTAEAAAQTRLASATPALTLEDASHLIDGGRVYATAHALRLSFVVVDPGGHVVMSARMDGAAFATLAFSEGKAYASAAAGGLNGAELIDRYRAEPWIWGNAAVMAGGGPMLPGAGTFPLRRDGVYVGSIAASGAGPSDDDAAALAAAIAAHLETR